MVERGRGGLNRGGRLINFPPLKGGGVLNRGFTVKFFREGTVGDHQQFRDVSKFGTNDKFFMNLACEPQRITSAKPSGKMISVAINLLF